MKYTKSIGIWMDHANAHIIEFTVDPITTTTIRSTFTSHARADSLEKSEHLMHNMEQHRQLSYYKRVGLIIKKYTSVVLFGPTNAKVELFNMLQADGRFKDIKIEVRQAGKMTNPREHAFVKHHFSGVNKIYQSA